MAELVASVREHGVLQPILVRPWPASHDNPENKLYQIVAGERRWRAALESGVATIKCVVRAMSDAQSAELALVENVTRQDVSLAELADGCQDLIKRHAMNPQRIATTINKGEAVVDGLLKLAQMPHEIKAMFGQKKAGEWRPTLAHVHEFWKWREYPLVLTYLADKVAKAEIPASRLDNEMSSYELANAGVAKYVHGGTAKFEWEEICPRCPFNAYRKVGFQHMCFRPDEFERKNQEAEERAGQEGLRVLDEAKHGQKIVVLNDLDAGVYVDLSYNHNSCEGCTMECPCRARGLNRVGKMVQVCLDKKRHDKLEREAKKVAKEQHKKNVEALYDLVMPVVEGEYGQAESPQRWSKTMLPVAQVVLSHCGKAAVKDACKELDLKFDIEGYFSYALSSVMKMKELSRYPYDVLMRLCGHAILCKEYDELVEWERGESPVYKALLGQWPEEQKKMAVADDGDDGEPFVENIPAVEEQPFLARWEEASRQVRNKTFGTTFVCIKVGEGFETFLEHALDAAKMLQRPLKLYTEEGSDVEVAHLSLTADDLVTIFNAKRDVVVLLADDAPAWKVGEHRQHEQPQEADVELSSEVWEAHDKLMEEYPGLLRIYVTEDFDSDANGYLLGEDAERVAALNDAQDALEEVTNPETDEQLMCATVDAPQISEMVAFVGEWAVVWQDGELSFLDGDGEETSEAEATAESKRVMQHRAQEGDDDEMDGGEPEGEIEQVHEALSHAGAPGDNGLEGDPLEDA